MDDANNGTTASVYYAVLNNAGNAYLSDRSNSTVRLANGTLDQEAWFLFQMPNVENTFNNGELNPLKLQVWAKEENGDPTDYEDSATTVIYVLPKVVAGLDNGTGTADNGNLETDEIRTSFSNGNTIALDISGFVTGDTLQITVDGVAHAVLNADAAVVGDDGTNYGDLDAAGAGFTVQGSGTTKSGGANELILIKLGDTDGDGTVDHYFASGDHTITVTGSTAGDQASTTITVVTPNAAIQKTTTKIYSYAPQTNNNGGVNATTVYDNGGNVIPGSTAYLALNAVAGQDFKASTNYLILFENSKDSLNLVKVGSFTSTSEGRIPLGTSFVVPDNALPGTHNILIAEDTNGDGEYTSGTDTIVVGPNAMQVVVYFNADVDQYIRHIGDTVTVTVKGLNPENETDADQATLYQVLLDKDGNGPDLDDPAFPTDGFTPDENGSAEVSFTVPDIPGGTVNIYVVEKGTLNRLEPQSFVNFKNVDGSTDGDGQDEDAEIFITPNITLDKYSGSAGDTVTVTGKGFQPGTAYVITIGYINDANINQRGQVVASFTADSEGRIPSGVTFTVPTANNAAYGVTVSPTPAANYIDVAVDTGTNLASALAAGDQPIFTVGGTSTTLQSASAENSTSVKVTFSGALQSSTAENPANYAITDENGTAVSVSAASYNSADNSVTLTLGSELEAGKTYTLTVSNLRDSYNNLLSGSVQFSVAAPSQPEPVPTSPNSTAVNATDAYVSVGDIANGGDSMELKMNFPAYESPVDIYAAIQLPDGTLYCIDSNGSLTESLVPYATNSTQAHSDTIFDEFDVCTPFGPAIPEGTYYVYMLVLPAGKDINNVDWANDAYDLTYFSFDVKCD